MVKWHIHALLAGVAEGLLVVDTNKTKLASSNHILYNPNPELAQVVVLEVVATDGVKIAGHLFCYPEHLSVPTVPCGSNRYLSAAAVDPKTKDTTSFPISPH